MRPLVPVLAALALIAATAVGCGARPPKEPAIRAVPAAPADVPHLPELHRPSPPQPSPPETAPAAPGYTSLEVAAGPGRNGPWHPVRDGAVVPADHAWLRLAFSRRPGDVVFRSGMQTLNLPLEPEGEATLYVNLEQAPADIRMESLRDAGGQIVQPPMLRLIRGERPAVWSRSTAGGEPKVLATLDVIPAGDAWARYTPPVPPASPPRMRFEEYWNLAVSPDGKYLALLEKPSGPFDPAGRIEPVGLRIYDQTTRTEVLGVPEAVRILQGIPPCTGANSALAWRPDGTAIAAVGVGEGTVQLALFEVQGGTRRVLAVRPGAPYESHLVQVAWSPGGRHLVFGGQLLDAATGGAVATLSLTDRSRHRFYWSSAGDYLLYGSERVFLDYGPVYLVRAADGHQQELGYGKALGWTATGEAVYVLWDAARHLQLDGPKDCG